MLKKRRYDGRVRDGLSPLEKEQIREALKRQTEISYSPSTIERRVSEAGAKYERAMVRKALEAKGQK